MAKTIVVEVHRQKAHPFYKRVVKRSKKFYAHDENATAKLGDVVKIEETRPLSKLKRWQLKEVVRKAAQVAPVEEKPAIRLTFGRSKERNYGSDDEDHARGCRQLRRAQAADDPAAGRRRPDWWPHWATW